MFGINRQVKHLTSDVGALHHRGYIIGNVQTFYDIDFRL